MKKIICVLFALVMCISLSSVCLAKDPSRLVDAADILTDAEEETLLAQLDEISERQELDVVIVTVETVGAKSMQEYADDYYDEMGYSGDGILLLVATEEGARGEVWISTCGYGIDVLSDSDIDDVLDTFAKQYRIGNYLKAFGNFAIDCDTLITEEYESDKFDPVFSGVIAVAVGLVVALIGTGIMKGKLKSVRFRSEATEYVKSGSLNVSESRDFFLYRTVTRRERPKNNSNGSSTHTSSSGRTHGGGGRSL